ncbi:MAG: DNA starvation/stationary phase protection protein [Polyangiaceae bacterium]|nr:DNA starvation/stationary phase protection protein [Polyangiaceae bacterium]
MIYRDIQAPAIGLDADTRRQSVAILNRVLSNAALLQQKTRKSHWDVVGPQFYSLHKLWDTHYERLNARVDEIAERIRQLGGYPIGTASGWVQSASIRENPGSVSSSTEAVLELMTDHEHISRTLRSDIARLHDELHDFGTADFFTDLLRDHEEMAWMLRSFVQGTAVEADGEISHGAVPQLA